MRRPWLAAAAIAVSIAAGTMGVKGCGNTAVTAGGVQAAVPATAPASAVAAPTGRPPIIRLPYNGKYPQRLNAACSVVGWSIAHPRGTTEIVGRIFLGCETKLPSHRGKLPVVRVKLQHKVAGVWRDGSIRQWSRTPGALPDGSEYALAAPAQTGLWRLKAYFSYYPDGSRGVRSSVSAVTPEVYVNTITR